MKPSPASDRHSLFPRTFPAMVAALGLLLGGRVGTARGAALSPGDLDPSFVVRDLAANEQVQQILVQPDEKILVASYTFGPEPMRRRLIRLLPDGALDPEFKEVVVSGAALWNIGMPAIVLQGDRILVGGDFRRLNGQEVPGLARLLPDGSLDSSFEGKALSPYAYGIEQLAITADGGIVAAGEVVPSSFPRLLLEKLGPNGALDPAFAPAVNLAGSSSISGLTPAADGSFLVHGLVVSAAPQISYFGLFKLDARGGLIRGFQPPYARPVIPTAVTRLANGKVLVGSRSLPAYSLIRLEADGTRDGSFQIGWGPDNGITQIVEQPDGRILVAGEFSTWANQPQPLLARLEADGRLDHSFRPPTTPINALWKLALQNSRRAIFAGVVLPAGAPSGGQLAAIYIGPPPETPPRILRGPSPIHAETGDRATLTVEAAGYPRQAQWSRDQQPVPGATNEWLRFDALTSEDAGLYSLTLNSPLGSVSSDPVAVVVDPQPPGPNLIANASFESVPPQAPDDGVSTLMPEGWSLESGVASLMRAPIQVPVNFFGTEDALHGTNYLRLDYDQSANGGLMQGGRIRGSLVEPLKPGARYEFSAWLSLADRSVAPAVRFQAYLQGPGLGSLPLGSQGVTNREGWTSMSTFVVPGNGYNQLVLETQLEPTRTFGSRYLYIDKLALRSVEDRTPTLAPIPPITLSPFSSLRLTNEIQASDQPEILDANLRFRLGSSTPADATLDSFAGILFWEPDSSFAGTQVTLPIEAYLLQSPAPPSTNWITVQVQEGVSIAFGTHIVAAGGLVTLPLTIDARLAPDHALETLTYEVVPLGASFPGAPLEELAPEVERAEFLPLAHGVVQVTVKFRPGALKTGVRSLGNLHLSAGTPVATGDSLVTVRSVSATRSGNGSIPVVLAQDGLLHIVSREPLLQAGVRQGVPTLLLYGVTGHRYRVEQATRLLPTADWQPAREIVAEAFPQEIRGLNESRPVLFFRAVNLTP